MCNTTHRNLQHQLHCLSVPFDSKTCGVHVILDILGAARNVSLQNENEDEYDDDFGEMDQRETWSWPRQKWSG